MDVFTAKKLCAIAILLTASNGLYAGENSDFTQARALEARSSGSHALYLYGNIPDQGCTNSDRAIITEDGYGSKTLIQLATKAVETGLLIQIYVNGCVLINPGISSLSAPKVTKIKISQR